MAQAATRPISARVAAGYALPSPDYTRENAAINLYTSLGSLTSLVAQSEQAYFVDTANADGGRGHRIQMLDDNQKEVGAAVLTGSYNYTPTGSQTTTTYQAFESVIDFGFHDTVPYLTGVAYNDDIIQDNFYTPGEGLAGVNVLAVRTSDGKTFTTQTFGSGGYTLPLEAGTYDVYAGMVPASADLFTTAASASTRSTSKKISRRHRSAMPIFPLRC